MCALWWLHKYLDTSTNVWFPNHLNNNGIMIKKEKNRNTLKIIYHWRVCDFGTVTISFLFLEELVSVHLYVATIINYIYEMSVILWVLVTVNPGDLLCRDRSCPCKEQIYVMCLLSTDVADVRVSQSLHDLYQFLDYISHSSQSLLLKNMMVVLAPHLKQCRNKVMKYL